ncbi:unnamed protein product [Dibothriocephalus latus]|uniref:JmjC domain-containing protein n=1 Tax=Dibothriocephalus latus TaxID=60516 RepID=A0A3P7LUZ1_DIBLA|nr:unnamed protein product [Dibothriocephalus latus]
MRNQAAELFDLSPDLLHHITTIMNPNLIQAEGVPIYRTDQHCGEFVVTFPRAYHAGFNQGFNFAEAVNICCPDWVRFQSPPTKHYASVKRQCVFSNDELLLTLAEVAAGIRPMEQAAMWTDLTAERFRSTKSTGFDINALSIIHEEFAAVLEREVAHRTRLAGLRSERERLDELVDDERVCAVCQTTLFFSALICVCKASKDGQKAGGRPTRTAASKRKNAQTETNDQETSPVASPSKMVCLAHADSVCGSCKLKDCTVKYTYTIEELEAVRAKLAEKLAGYDAWRTEFGQFLGVLNAPTTDSKGQSVKSEPDSAKPCCTTTLREFELKLAEAEKCGYHNDLLYRRATTYLKSLKDLVTICDQVVDFLDSKHPKGDDHSEAISIATFQLKRPATFTISSGSSDSVNKAYLNVNHEVDLRNAKETIAASRAFILPGPGVQLLSADATKTKPEAPLEGLQQQFSKLAQDLRTEFPGWCDHMEDFAIMTLVSNWGCFFLSQ